MTEGIAEGDYVKIVVNKVALKGMVVSIPEEQGDSWRIMTNRGDIRYIQRYESIEKLPPSEEIISGHL